MPQINSKKEFITYWSNEQLVIDPKKLTLSQQSFFDFTYEIGGKLCCAIVPDSIPYQKLLGFIGRKTKVTIEVIE